MEIVHEATTDKPHNVCCKCGSLASVEFVRHEFNREPVKTFYCHACDPHGERQTAIRFLNRELSWKGIYIHG